MKHRRIEIILMTPFCLIGLSMRRTTNQATNTCVPCIRQPQCPFLITIIELDDATRHLALQMNQVKWKIGRRWIELNCASMRIRINDSVVFVIHRGSYMHNQGPLRTLSQCIICVLSSIYDNVTFCPISQFTTRNYSSIFGSIHCALFPISVFFTVFLLVGLHRTIAPVTNALDCINGIAFVMNRYVVWQSLTQTQTIRLRTDTKNNAQPNLVRRA